MAEAIRITGLRELQAALRRTDSTLPKQLRIALNKASDEVIDYASPRFPRRTGRAAASLKARSTQRAARVGLGGRRAAYAPWLVYGGQGRKHGRPAPRPFVKQGRDFGPYAALDRRRERITEILEQAIGDVARDAGLEVS
ncbi:HK97 gp10 family phage protein [Actinoplanes sp. NPDC051851]|uniref:HK97 gp10 family phage protein n=1 Tax=Actinoplanes sp. NPDC051851 TaxID=3154753 RepID=UPI00342C3763